MGYLIAAIFETVLALAEVPHLDSFLVQSGQQGEIQLGKIYKWFVRLPDSYDYDQHFYCVHEAGPPVHAPETVLEVSPCDEKTSSLSIQAMHYEG